MVSLGHRSLGDVDLIRLTGRLDRSDRGRVAARLATVLERGTGVAHLELSALDSIDASGLSVLVALAERARRRDGDVVLYNVTAEVRALLELTRLHGLFESNESDDYRHAVLDSLAR